MDFSQPSCASHIPAAQGALLKEADLVRWLQIKLQDREKWAGREGTQYVSREMIEELMMCFSTVENPTKLKVVLSFLYLTPRQSKTWKESLTGLLNIARRDPDDWVEVISELFRDVPMAGGIKPSVEDLASYQKMIDELRQMADDHDDAGNLRTDPPSFNICNSHVVKALFEKEPVVQKHFALKKKPKSQALLQDIRKQSDILNNQKRDRKEAIISGSLPIKIRSTRREANNTLPMRGIPNQNQVKMSQGFTNEPKKFIRPLAKREGGVKLLDIGDLPMSLKQRRQVEREDEKKRAIEEKEHQRKAKEEEKKQQAEVKRQAVIKAKDDAVRHIEEQRNPLEKLAKPVLKTEPIRIPMKNSSAVPQSLKRPASPAELPHQSLTKPIVEPKQQLRQPVPQQDFVPTSEPPLTHIQPQHHVPTHQPQPMQVQQQLHQPLHHQPMMQQQMQQQMPQQMQQQIQQPRQQQMHQPQLFQIPQQQQQPYNPNLQRPVIVQNYPGTQSIQIPGSSQMQQQPSFLLAAPQQPTGIVDFQDADVARKCQEILNSANALDDCGRNLVVQFMKGGLRCGPTSQNMDHIMTLKLSENIENGLVDGRHQKLKVEVFFQMDLSNGEWKRLRKCRMLEGEELGLMSQQHSQPSWHSQQYNPQRFI